MQKNNQSIYFFCSRETQEIEKEPSTVVLLVLVGPSAAITIDGTLTILFDKSDWGRRNFWQNGDIKDGWFQVDFKDRRLVMTHYAIHNSVYWVRDVDFLRTWTVEGSNDEKTWSVIDTRTNDETLHGKDKIQALFRCNGDTKQAFRFIRLYQRGVSHNLSSHRFLISHFEVFGLLSE
jgi:general stress protein 26